MFPMKVVPGEHDSRIKSSRPASSRYQVLDDDIQFSEYNEYVNHNSDPLSTIPTTSQDRKIASVVHENTHSSSKSSHPSRLSSLSFLKLAIKPNNSQTYKSISSPSSPRRSSFTSRHSLANFSLLSGSGFSRNNPHALPPTHEQSLSPAHSTESLSPTTASPSNVTHHKRRSELPPTKNSRSFHFHKDMRRSSRRSSINSHLEREIEHVGRGNNHEMRQTAVAGLIRHKDDYDVQIFQQDEDVVILSNGEFDPSEDNFYAHTHPQLPHKPSLSERRNVPRLSTLYPATIQKNSPRIVQPASPPLTDSSLYDSRSVSDDYFGLYQEVEERQTGIPDILKPRLQSVSSYYQDDIYHYRLSASSTPARSPSRRLSAMDDLDFDSLEELESAMDDMNAITYNAEKEIKRLMYSLTHGQHVVRKPEDVPDNETVRSPQILPPNYYSETSHLPSRVSRSMLDALHTPRTEDEDEIMTREIQKLMAELSESPLTDESDEIAEDLTSNPPPLPRSSTIRPRDYEPSPRVRSMAENEGLHEMPRSPDVDNPVDVIHISPKQQEVMSTKEYGNCLGISYDDMEIIDDEMIQELVGYNMKKSLDDIELENRLKTLPNRFTAQWLKTPKSKPEIKRSNTAKRPALAKTPLLEDIRADGKIARFSDSNDTVSSSQTKDSKTKNRKHNLKENEIRVEDPAYLTVFKTYLKESKYSDIFISRETRFDAVQTRRICNEIPHEHRPLPPPPRDISTEPLEPIDPARPPTKLMTPEEKRMKEVKEEIMTRLWVFAAAKWLNYDRLLLSPGHDMLYKASIDYECRTPTSKPLIKRKVLDLGGAPVADWGWFCAYEYPHSKVYTVTSRPKNINIDNVELPEAGIIEKRRFRGPSNHRHIKVSSLWNLPFPDNHFDIVSARSLHNILKDRAPERKRTTEGLKINTPGPDEYTLTLQECYRILKPGGYLEFNIMDSDILRPGPEGQNISERFMQELRNNGYDPQPTTRWIPRLRRAGFNEVQRTWTVTPMAPPRMRPKTPPKRNLGKYAPQDDLLRAEEEVQKELDAIVEAGVVKGTTKDVAFITGLVSNWRWEEWMIKLDSERMLPEGKKGLVKGIRHAIEEGRERGSGWRNLVGWARKPGRRER